MQVIDDGVYRRLLGFEEIRHFWRVLEIEGEGRRIRINRCKSGSDEAIVEA